MDKQANPECGKGTHSEVGAEETGTGTGPAPASGNTVDSLFRNRQEIVHTVDVGEFDFELGPTDARETPDGTVACAAHVEAALLRWFLPLWEIVVRHLLSIDRRLFRRFVDRNHPPLVRLVPPGRALEAHLTTYGTAGHQGHHDRVARAARAVANASGVPEHDPEDATGRQQHARAQGPPASGSDKSGLRTLRFACRSSVATARQTSSRWQSDRRCPGPARITATTSRSS